MPAASNRFDSTLNNRFVATDPREETKARCEAAAAARETKSYMAGLAVWMSFVDCESNVVIVG
jgi:hypothetical protein